MGKKPFYPLIPGESKKERKTRLAKESVARQKERGHVPVPRLYGRYKYPLIEGETKEQRKKRLTEELQWKVKNPEEAKSVTLKRMYGIDLDQLELMTKQQNGLCKICKKKDENKSLHVDHCHKTGLVRGLLCEKCNRGLGMFLDSPDLLKSAIEYLSFSFDPKKDFVCI